MSSRPANILPGFGLSLGYASIYMSLLVLIPLAGLGVKSTHLSWERFCNTITNPFVISACKLSFLSAIGAALLNGVFGTIIAWTLVRYRFPGRKIFDAIIDLPFAMPTAVAGLTFADLFSVVPGLSRQPGAEVWYIMGVDGLDLILITIMLTFVGLPYVIRSVQPILQDWDIETEQAAMSLGAGSATIMNRLILPEIWPAWISGVGLAFARGVGEFGSIVFIASNIPGRGQIAPQIIIDFIYDPVDPDIKIASATSVALVLLTASLAILLALNFVNFVSRRHTA